MREVDLKFVTEATSILEGWSARTAPSSHTYFLKFDELEARYSTSQPELSVIIAFGTPSPLPIQHDQRINPCGPVHLITVSDYAGCSRPDAHCVL